MSYGTCCNNEDHYGKLCDGCDCCKRCCSCEDGNAGVCTTDPDEGLEEVMEMEDKDGTDSDKG